MTVELKNIRVTYRVAATVPTGGYSNLKPEYEISADVVSGSPSEVKDKLKSIADAWLEADVAEIEAEVG